MRRGVIFFALLFTLSFVLAKEIPAPLVKGLASEEFAEREKSQQALTEWAQQHPGLATKLIYELAVNDEDPEVRERCLVVLKALSEDDYLSEGFGYLGVSMVPELMQLDGNAKLRGMIRLTDVMVDSPAAKAGLQRNDLLAEVDGLTWEGMDIINGFQEYIGKQKPRTKVKMMVKRGGIDELMEVEVTLGRRPVANLEVGMDLEFLDQRARQRHFEEWLKRQGERK